MIPIGVRVLGLRKKANLTRKELADKMGIKLEDTITRIEMQITKPQPWTLLKMAQALDIAFTELIDGTDFEDSISELRVIPGQTVIAYRDADNKLRILYYPDENAPDAYAGGHCERFRCYKGRPHMHCCFDCPERNGCDVACQNSPDKCGLYIK